QTIYASSACALFFLLEKRTARVLACPRFSVNFFGENLGPSITSAVMRIVLSALLLVLAQSDIYKEGKAQLDAKHYEEAESAFRQLLTAQETSSKGYEGLALVEIARKNYDKALDNAKKAVELNGESAGAHYALGLAYAYREDFGNATPSLERAVSLDPENASIHYQLGLVDYRLKRYAQ